VLKSIKTVIKKSLIVKPFDKKVLTQEALREMVTYRAVVEILSKTSAILTDLLL